MMETDSKNLFTTAQNFGLLREKLGEYKSLPSEQEKRDFLEFLDDIYTIWKKNNPAPDLGSLERKAKGRRELINKLGIKGD